MTCLCGRYTPSDKHGLCSTCRDKPPSCLPPIGPLAQLIDRTSLEDFILFVIALNRKNREPRP